jgi:putative membrane protein
MFLTRPILFALGAIVLAGAWFTPGISFSAHMAAHMAVVAVAAPFLAAGIGGGSADPVGRYPKIFEPLFASFIELAAVWLWHTPRLHELARQNTSFLALEQLSFLGAGLYLWISALGGSPADIARRGAGVAALLLTAMHMTLLGALLALSPRAWYEKCHHAIAALPPLDDQQLGGAIMLVIGGVFYLGGGLWLALGLLYSRAPAPASATD